MDIDFADCFFDFVYFCVAEAFNFGEVAFCGCLDGVDGADSRGLKFGNVCGANSCNRQSSEGEFIGTKVLEFVDIFVALTIREIEKG